VNFTKTLVVCAPKMFSVTAPPNAAPSPSLFGRCIRMTRTMSSATNSQMARRRLITMFTGAKNMTQRLGEATGQAFANDEARMTNEEGSVLDPKLSH
jgi:hypothetical protein